jgi:5-methylcytosine-specific restriction endonuclease McrA
MSDIPAALRRLVVDRAAGLCEYCRLAQAGQEAVFHIDHIQPRAAGGPTTDANLALACVSCSLRKGAREKAVDPESGGVVPLFNPRSQKWDEHFHWQAEFVVGLTPTGRATIVALAMNRPLVVAIRKELAARGA